MFTKMHGLGNSFVIFNQLGVAKEYQDYRQLAQIVSNVSFGIGSDGIILICSSDIADFRMRIFNVDGSEGKNCGNGLRCVAKLLFDEKYVTTSSFTIETLGGVMRVEVEADDEQQVQNVTVDMGEPELLKNKIPMQGDPCSVAVNEPHFFGDDVYLLTCVSMGNPHAIIFSDDVKKVPLEKIGPIIECSDLFPERINVGFVTVKNSQEIEYRVWERGSGITMACGTGACAAVVAATLNGMLDRDLPITVHLPGGDLTVRWDEHGNVWKRGEATYICHGELMTYTNRFSSMINENEE
ncbi:Diaminopimelate epimerase [Lysinibacillus sphaericus]|nr:Diaminopimelate epimerase [Lysinibacillus sphaericus]